MAERHVADADSSQRSSPAMMARISAMMFLQYWPLGVWGVTVGTYIAANTGKEGTGIFSAGFVGYSTAAGAIGSLLSPVAIGFLSDRYFAAQYLLALLHVGCALAAWGMYESHSQAAFFMWMLIYYQCFSPAAALTNKIGLKHLANADAEYPLVRIFSTIGWITAGLFVGFAWPLATGESIEPTRIPLMIGACGSIVMALFSLTLPHTPPEERERTLSVSHFARQRRPIAKSTARRVPSGSDAGLHSHHGIQQLCQSVFEQRALPPTGGADDSRTSIRSVGSWADSLAN